MGAENSTVSIFRVDILYPRSNPGVFYCLPSSSMLLSVNPLPLRRRNIELGMTVSGKNGNRILNNIGSISPKGDVVSDTAMP